MQWSRISFALLTLLATGSLSVGAADDDHEPIVITSETLVVHNQDDKATFEGDVVLIQGTFKLLADRMVVKFADQSLSKDPSAPTVAGQKISTIKAVGHVKIFDGDQSATGRKAVYFGQEEKVVLTGQPEVWQDGYRVTGKKLTLFLNEDRSVVEGGSQVVITETGSLNFDRTAGEEK